LEQVVLKISKKQCREWGASPAWLYRADAAFGRRWRVVSLSAIAREMEMDDALWALRAAPDLAGRFAALCVEHALGVPRDRITGRVPKRLRKPKTLQEYQESDRTLALAYAAVAMNPEESAATRADAVEQAIHHVRGWVYGRDLLNDASGGLEAEEAWQQATLRKVCVSWRKP
jgi:hypothetical protein